MSEYPVAAGHAAAMLPCCAMFSVRAQPDGMSSLLNTARHYRSTQTAVGALATFQRLTSLALCAHEQLPSLACLSQPLHLQELVLENGLVHGLDGLQPVTELRLDRSDAQCVRTCLVCITLRRLSWMQANHLAWVIGVLVLCRCSAVWTA